MQQVSAILGSVITIYITLALYSLFQQNLQKKKKNALDFQLLNIRLESALLKRSLEKQFQLHWSGIRKFVVYKKKIVADDIYSFDLVPHDRKPLPLFKPGQFLTFQVKVPGYDKPQVRCYSISSAPNPKYYQVTIKRVPGGAVSNYFCDEIAENMILDVQAPRGRFCIEPESRKPLVLIAGGVGVTPFLSMVESIAEENREREIYLFYSAKKKDDLIKREFLESLAIQYENISVYFGMTQPLNQDEIQFRDFAGHLSVKYLRTILPSNNYDFYICGPDAMMSNLKLDLQDWKVPDLSIQTEAFGSGTTSTVNSNGKKKECRTLNEDESELLQVSFSKSDQKQDWNCSHDDLLSFIEQFNIPIDAGCRTGSCGNCETAIQSGTVKIIKEMNYPCHEGNCLPCVSIPETNLKLDL